MVVLKAVYENMEPNISNKKIYLEIDESNNYSISHHGFSKSKQYVTLLSAFSDTNIFLNKHGDIYGQLSIDYHSKHIRLNIYSNALINYYGIELDNKTGWLAI